MSLPDSLSDRRLSSSILVFEACPVTDSRRLAMTNVDDSMFESRLLDPVIKLHEYPQGNMCQRCRVLRLVALATVRPSHKMEVGINW